MPITGDTGNNLPEYFAAFRRRWWLIALVMFATVAVAALYTFRQPVLYRSTMKIVVGQQGGVFQPGVGNAADEFTQTMSDLLQSEVVASGAIERLRLDEEPAELLANLSVTTRPSSTVLNVSYDDQDEVRGTRILRTVGQEFTSLVAERLAKGNANITVSATVFNPAHSLGQVQPKPARNLAVAGMLGLLLGLLVAFVREQLDDTVRSVEQAEQAFGQVATVTIPPGIVGYHPFARGQGKRADPIITELSLQRLRATILWSPDTTNAPILLVTSANPAEGKTTIAANLAVLLVIEGRNVIVVDADLRHPTLHRYLGMPLPLGDLNLDAVMAGQISPLGALVDVPVPARAFALDGAGRPLDSWANVRREPPAPGKLRAILAAPGRGQLGEFDLARTAEVIEELRSDADVVIIDGPPILVVPDAYPFAASVDTVIAVVRNGEASVKATVALSRTFERLRARRVELVVTDAEPGFAQSYYYYQPRQGEGAPHRGERRSGNVLASENAIPSVPRRTARRSGPVGRDR